MDRRVNVKSDYIENKKLELDTMQLRTNLDFLKDQRGWRVDKMHLVIGPPGAGKSTARNMIILDALKANPELTVYLYLSEESLDDFVGSLSRSPELALYRHRIFVHSEQDEPVESENYEQSIYNLSAEVARSGAGLFIFDNLTTSSLYGESLKQQQAVSKLLKQVFNNLGTANIYFTHTSSDVRQGSRQMIDQNQIRGSRSINTLSEFLYIIQQFDFGGVENSKITTLRIVKHRSHSVGDKLFKFIYDPESQAYINARKMDYEHFKELLKKF